LEVNKIITITIRVEKRECGKIIFLIYPDHAAAFLFE
jgi:hypothetical protein